MQVIERSSPAGVAVEPTRASLATRLLGRDNIVLAILLAALTASWYYAWFRDGSHPISGVGWADQTLYNGAALRLAHGHLPTVKQLHYGQSYPLLGALASFLSPDDPFWLVAYVLIISSGTFLFRGARALLGTWFAVLFMLLVFAWDFYARTLAYPTEVFAIPWSNQMVFFAYAFFFWVYATRRTGPLDLKIVVAIGAVVGVVVTSREESVLFLVPLAVIYLVKRRAPWRAWLLCAGAAFVTALPALIIKSLVLGSVFASGRSRNYTGAAGWYFSWSNLHHNFLETIINSDFAKQDYNRKSLFEASPWLWLSPIGIGIVLAGRRFDALFKWFVAMSLVLITFYLSGSNVSARKLRFHCLRYMSPGYIALNFGVVVVAYQLWQLAKRGRRRREDRDFEGSARTIGA
jgi:hypothetical protein